MSDYSYFEKKAKDEWEKTYKKLKQHIERYSVYRTYDYNEARRSQVFLEPIVLPKEFREALVEN